VGRLRPQSARGGSRPNQNDYVFVILLTHHKSYIETTYRRDFGGKPSELRWGRVLSWKIPEFCSAGGARSKNSIFRVFRVPFDYPAHSRWKAETLKVCLLLVWRVCDQAFGRYRPLKGAEKWSRDHHENWKLHIDTCIKIHWSKNAILFDLRRKITEVIAEKPFPNSGVTRRLCGRLAVLNWRSSSIHPSSYIMLLYQGQLLIFTALLSSSVFNVLSVLFLLAVQAFSSYVSCGLFADLWRPRRHGP